MHAKRGKKNRSRSRHFKRDDQERKIKKRSPRVKGRIPASRKKGRKDVKKVAPIQIKGWRLWLFRFIAVIVIPALLFSLLEIALHIVGYGYPTAPTIKYKVNDQVYYCNNFKFGWRFFPPNISREFDPFVFPASKPRNTFRIFVLGASAAQGTPDQAFCFGRILRLMLREKYQGADFELITAAMPAINSHAVLEIAKDCSRHQADLFIVYLGNNEVVGPYGAGTAFAPLSNHLFLIRFGIALKATRVGQLIANLLGSIGSQKHIPKIWGGLEMFLDKQIQANNPCLDTVYQHFLRNLKDIRRIACKSGANIIFCTVGSNLKDSPPFASLHRLDLTETDRKKWDEIYQKGVEYESAGDYTEAVGSYLTAAQIDAQYAELQFRLGKCYWAVAEYDKARDSYIRARELDTFRFRADNRINQIIRDVANGREAEGVYMMDAVRAFEKSSPHNTPGEELFYEHVHLNFKGNYLLAKVIFEQLEEILPAWVRNQKVNNFSLLSEVQCAERLAYNDWIRYKIDGQVLNGSIKEAPFTNQLYHEERVRQMEQELKTLETKLTPEVLRKIAVQYRNAIQNDREDWWLRWKYAQLLGEELKDYRAAVEQYRLLLDSLPHYYKGHAALAAELLSLNRFDDSIDHCLKAIRIKPTYHVAYFNLGTAYLQQGKIDKTIECYSKVLQLQPYHAKACQDLGILLRKQGKLQEAVEIYQRGLLFMPENADLHNCLGLCYEQLERFKDAVSAFGKAIEYNTVLIAAYRNRGRVYEKLGDFAAASRSFEEAALISPPSQRVYIYDMLARSYFMQKKYGLALEALEKALELVPSDSEMKNYLQNRRELVKRAAEGTQQSSLEGTPP